MLYDTILANQISMIAAIVIRVGFRMIFTEYLVHILSLSKNIFDFLIDFERNLLFSVNIRVDVAMTVCAFKVIFLSYTSFGILRGFDHLGFYARFTGS
jgi:hypothetical protein